MKIIVALKGGPGSGNYGHSGRPGLVGGSGGEGGAPFGGGRFTGADPIRAGSIERHTLEWKSEDTIKGQVVIKHNLDAEPTEEQIKGFIARRLPRLLYFGDPDEGIEEIKIESIDRKRALGGLNVGFTIVNVDITPTSQQGAEWAEHESYGEAYYGTIGESIYGRE